MHANTVSLETAATLPPVFSSTSAAPSSPDQAATDSACRFCGSQRTRLFVDLGMSPLCESFLGRQQLDQMEPFYPLYAFVCEECLLVQLKEYVSGEEIFCDDYAYFSSYSDSWVEHARQYTEKVAARFSLNSNSQVIEVASNDGYLLQHFVGRGIPVLGIEPAANTAEAARAKGVKTIDEYFSPQVARRLVNDGVHADLLVGNNVLAHVPDLNGFVAALKILLAKTGVLTMEFPHLQQLIEQNQFDTIYHEHFCYFSFQTVSKVFRAHGLEVFDVDQLPTHGGSLRVYARHVGDDSKPVMDNVVRLSEQESAAGLDNIETYGRFTRRVETTKHQLLHFLIQAKAKGKRIAGYGAPGKGNTLLNYCGIRQDFLDYTVDRNPGKHGKYTPGTHIPIHPPDKIFETQPDYVLILPWNLRSEITKQMEAIRSWGGQFIVPIPEVTVC